MRITHMSFREWSGHGLLGSELLKLHQLQWILLIWILQVSGLRLY